MMCTRSKHARIDDNMVSFIKGVNDELFYTLVHVVKISEHYRGGTVFLRYIYSTAFLA